MSVTGPARRQDTDAATNAVATVDTPVGRLSVAVSDVGLAEVCWGEVEQLRSGRRSRTVVDPDRTAPVLEQLSSYFAAERQHFDLDIDWRACSATQRAVFEALHQNVVYGQSTTYGGLAVRSGTGIPARGIGALMGANPVPIVVPCHRVLAADGLGGYSGGTKTNGLEVKRWLLMLEGALPQTLDWDPGRMTAV